MTPEADSSLSHNRIHGKSWETTSHLRAPASQQQEPAPGPEGRTVTVEPSQPEAAKARAE